LEEKIVLYAIAEDMSHTSLLCFSSRWQVLWCVLPDLGKAALQVFWGRVMLPGVCITVLAGSIAIDFYNKKKESQGQFGQINRCKLLLSCILKFSYEIQAYILLKQTGVKVYTLKKPVCVFFNPICWPHQGYCFSTD